MEVFIMAKALEAQKQQQAPRQLALQAAIAVADRHALENPRFDRARFFQACGAYAQAV